MLWLGLEDVTESNLEHMSKIIHNLGRVSKNVNMEYRSLRFTFSLRESQARAEYHLAPIVEN